MNILSDKIVVNVAGQVFQIPSEKMGELLRILSSWNSIQTQESSANQTGPRYNGKQLIQG